MTARFTRFACIDWSGAQGERLAGIAVASCAVGNGAPAIETPPGGGRWSRAAVLGWLETIADSGEEILIGIDFSASFPFLDRGAFFPGLPDPPHDAKALWALIDTLCAADPYFSSGSFVRDARLARHFRVGVRTGDQFASPDGNGRLRAVEREEASGTPSSCFNLVGARQVGKSSLTGMRVLHRLAGRMPVWPIDPLPPAGPLIVEIYTSIAACAAGRRRGATKMRSIAELNAALGHPVIASRPVAGEGAIDDHRSDAILTAAWMRRAAADPALWIAPPPTIARTEGWTFGVPYRMGAAKPA